MRDDFDERMRKMRRQRERMSFFVAIWIALSAICTIAGLIGLAYVALHPELIGAYLARITSAM